MQLQPHGSLRGGPGAARFTPTSNPERAIPAMPRRSPGQLFPRVGPTSSSASRNQNQINASPVRSSKSSFTGELCQIQWQRTISLITPTPPALAGGSCCPIRNTFSTVQTALPPTGLQPVSELLPETAGMGHSDPRTVAPRET